MRRALPLLPALFALLAAAPAAAGPLVGIADDRVLLHGGPPADEAVADWAAQGVDVVRIFAQWDEIAPRPSASSRPEGGVYDFARVDAAVDRVRAAGMEPILTLTGPGPRWGMSDPSRGSRRYRPDPRAYAGFARDAAQHFLGRVRRYILWNEPNVPFWLQPQWRCTRASCSPVAPHVYRDLVAAAGPAIRAVDPGAQTFIGALAPRGASVAGTATTMRPLTFLRALGCVDRHYRRLRGGACAGFRAPRATALAYHPHSVTNRPSKPFASPDDANLASLGRVESVLDRLRHAGRLRVGRDLWLDEYGYQTDPPDRFLGVSPGEQDRWLQQGFYRAWRDPRVRLLTQYVWIDEPAGGGLTGWQSGLRYADGGAKPALAHFATPFFLDARRGRLWGQVRPGGAHTVEVQRRLRGRRWATVARLRTDARGYWSRRLALVRGARYRFRSDARISAARLAG